MNEHFRKNSKQRREMDIKFRLYNNTRTRITKSLKNIAKIFSTNNFSGIDIETYEKWIELQLTPDLNW